MVWASAFRMNKSPTGCMKGMMNEGMETRVWLRKVTVVSY